MKYIIICSAAFLAIALALTAIFLVKRSKGSTGEVPEDSAPDSTGDTVTGSLPDVPETDSIKPRAVLVIEAGGRIFYAHFEDNSSAQAFRDKLNSGGLTVEMSDYGGFEKVGDLPWELPRNDAQITTKPGDIILYQGDKITVYYGENTWNFTRLASIGNTSKEELLSALGEGDASVTFSLEWSE
ncbi:MAG: hypothetical protein IJS45_10590 [Clostridia bacterium]|nr:hypothetical protein [Clostridia bacterium]